MTAEYKNAYCVLREIGSVTLKINSGCVEASKDKIKCYLASLDSFNAVNHEFISGTFFDLYDKLPKREVWKNTLTKEKRLINNFDIILESDDTIILEADFDCVAGIKLFVGI